VHAHDTTGQVLRKPGRSFSANRSFSHYVVYFVITPHSHHAKNILNYSICWLHKLDFESESGDVFSGNDVWSNSYREGHSTKSCALIVRRIARLKKARVWTIIATLEKGTSVDRRNRLVWGETGDDKPTPLNTTVR